MTPHTTDQTTYPAREHEVIHWLGSHFGSYPGRICVGAIDGDPRFEAMQHTWFSNKNHAAIAHYLVELEALGRNLYVGHCRFNRSKRAYGTAQHSVWLWLDDVPATLNATELIQTSATSYQAWIRLDTPLDAATRSTWQKHIAAATGADHCSADAVHMVRGPFGLNTKQHGAFVVRSAGGTGQTYTLADLEARYGTPSATSAPICSSWSQTERRCCSIH